MPDWLIKKMRHYQKSHPALGVQLAQYNGKTAYYVPARCCDIASELYDSDGHLICHPDGGFVGGDGKCPSFTQGKKIKP